MRRGIATLLVLACLFALALTPAAAREPSAQRWIVQLEAGAQLDDVAATARTQFRIAPGQRFSSVLNGFAATMTAPQREALAADPRVRAIVLDRPVWSTAQPGVHRVGAMDNEQRANADPETGQLDVDIAVLDTGIQPDNRDLNVVGGYNCTDQSKPNAYGDSPDFGHGTHVAGIAAAHDTDRNVAGVAQGARLWAIKVLNSSGNGYWSWVICGLDRVAAMVDADGITPEIEVINMSLASSGSDDGDCGRSNSDLLHQAICRVNSAGITQVVAAGNRSADAAGYIPGAYDEVITVSAMADWNGLADGVDDPPAAGAPADDCPRNYSDDAFAGFSNYGADVDLIAPGTCVISTLPMDTEGLMSGTSMATPHVAGGAALYYLAEEAAGRNRPTPEQVRAALVARGTLDWLTATDGDRNQAGSTREPALYVGDFELDPFFEIGTRRQLVRAAVGSSFENDVWEARIAGHTGTVELDVDETTLPAGSVAEFDGPTLSVGLPGDVIPGTYEVEISGTSGLQTSEVSFRLVVFDDTADPGGPVVSIRSGQRTGVVTIPVRISWPQIAKAKRYMVGRSIDGGDWATIGKTYGTGINVNATPGARYQFRVRAKVGGVWREWLNGQSAVLTVYDPGTSLTMSGTWQHATIDDAYSELPVFSSEAGASATLSFTGRSVGWIGSRGPKRGRAQIRIDGSLVSTLDTYAGTKRNRLLLFARSWSDSGPHTLRLDVVGRPESRPRIDVDAIVVVSN